MRVNEVALYDWSPLLQLLLVGALIASVPLAWVWHRNRKRGPWGLMHALTVTTLILTFDLVMFGAFTRLTDSGLGCPDWPGCYGSASPIGAHAQISAAEQAMPDGPVTQKKAWIEIIHRYFAKAIGALIVVMTGMGWWLWRRWRRRPPEQSAQQPPPHPVWPTLTLLWVLLQGAFGAWTVTMKLMPAIVTLHLLGGVVLLMLLAVQAVWWRRATQGVSAVRVDGLLRAALWLSLAVVMVQIALGGWVSTNYAVLACTTFPDCNGQWWPQMQFDQAFTVWRELGHQADGQLLTLPALVAIHYVHRLFALVVLAVAGWAVVRLWRAGEPLRQLARWLAGLLLLQAFTGVSNVVFDWPIVAAVLHTAGAAALAVVLTLALAMTRRLPASALSALLGQSNVVQQVHRASTGRGRAA
ncbi:heme A synthase [Allofranklinella schreckenbergeri]|uniref:Heme A synthase n=1 Tax=Allofranklinella schreckenbergeri TaxID=1076744 RepID=A0A3M6QHY3_9BURK|nr:heme A synthase [Allofranklinella schreckenbergeri]